MLKALQHHWRDYLIEAWGLGMFMVMAGSVATLLFSPSSPVVQWIPDPMLRRSLMGMAMGLTAISIIYSPWGKRSGAHLNPSVTLTFFRLKKLAPWDALFYVVAQFLGGALGVFLVGVVLGSLFTDPPISAIATVPGQWGWLAALLTEFLMAWGLMTIVLITANIPRLANYTGIFAGLTVATYITLLSPISGMSMNPARSTASALSAQIWTAFWIYYLAPPLGMLTAAEIYRRVTKLRTRSICCKLCPNGETPCISIDCCGGCETLVRPWRTSADTDKELTMRQG